MFRPTTASKQLGLLLGIDLGRNIEIVHLLLPGNKSIAKREYKNWLNHQRFRCRSEGVGKRPRAVIVLWRTLGSLC